MLRPMRPVHFHITMLDGVPGEIEGAGAVVSQNDRDAMLREMMEALIAIDTRYLQRHPNTPPLYQSGVKYQQQRQSDDWLDIGGIVRDGVGDVEDLAAWRVAELRIKGQDAQPLVHWDSRGLYTVAIVTDGQTEHMDTLR